MKEGTKLLISVRENTKSEESTQIQVTVLDTITDVRKVVDTDSGTYENIPVTRYLVYSKDGRVFCIFHNQIRKVLLTKLGEVAMELLDGIPVKE